MTLDLVIFLISSVVAVFGATMMITQRNPIASVLFMILSLLAQAVLYIQLGALFMGAVLVIVYAGAILVLFLFVIMLLNLRGHESLGQPSPPISLTIKYALAVLFVLELIMVVKSSFSSDLFADAGSPGVMVMQTDTFGAANDVAVLLFQRYLYPFELTSILLLVAVVGAVILAHRSRDDDGPVDAASSGESEGKAAE